MTIGERLKSRLEDLEIRQNELAKRLNISPTTLNGYFTNYREPDINTLIRLADELETSVEFLTTGKSLDQSPPSEVVLTDGLEFSFLKGFRELDSDDRDELNRSLERMLELKRLREGKT